MEAVSQVQMQNVSSAPNVGFFDHLEDLVEGTSCVESDDRGEIMQNDNISQSSSLGSSVGLPKLSSDYDTFVMAYLPDEGWQLLTECLISNTEIMAFFMKVCHYEPQYNSDWLTKEGLRRFVCNRNKCFLFCRNPEEHFKNITVPLDNERTTCVTLKILREGLRDSQDNVVNKEVEKLLGNDKQFNKWIKYAIENEYNRKWQDFPIKMTPHQNNKFGCLDGGLRSLERFVFQKKGYPNCKVLVFENITASSSTQHKRLTKCFLKNIDVNFSLKIVPDELDDGDFRKTITKKMSKTDIHILVMTPEMFQSNTVPKNSVVIQREQVSSDNVALVHPEHVAQASLENMSSPEVEGEQQVESECVPLNTENRRQTYPGSMDQVESVNSLPSHTDLENMQQDSLEQAEPANRAERLLVAFRASQRTSICIAFDEDGQSRAHHANLLCPFFVYGSPVYPSWQEFMGTLLRFIQLSYVQSKKT